MYLNLQQTKPNILLFTLARVIITPSEGTNWTYGLEYTIEENRRRPTGDRPTPATILLLLHSSHSTTTTTTSTTTISRGRPVITQPIKAICTNKIRLALIN